MAERDDAESFVRIGKVVSVNFVKRQLRILPETDHLDRFTEIHQALVRTADGHLERFDIDAVEVAGTRILMTVRAGIDGDRLASARGAAVVVHETERHALAKDEYYVDDLIGMEVVDRSGRSFGRVYAIYKTGANDVYEVRDDKGNELLVPAVKDRVLKVDVANGLLTINPEGLTDISDAD